MSEDRTSLFESLGEAQVRDTAPSWYGDMKQDAYAWLRAKDLERARQSRLNTIASIIAAIASVAALIMAALAWRCP